MKMHHFSIMTAMGIMAFLVLSSCAAPTPDYSISFVTVREAGLRVGPVPLPLQAEGAKQILTFLERGGNRSNSDYGDAGAAQFYVGLFDLLRKDSFLYANNFRQPGKIDQVSDTLSQWFNKTIIYQLIDGRMLKPPVPNPICVTDGKYWWIFYLQDKKPGESDFKVKELLITESPAKYFKHYSKITEEKPPRTYSKLRCTNKHGEKTGASGETGAAAVVGVSRQPGQNLSHCNDIHKVFLDNYLTQIADVYLVAKLKTEELGFTGNDVRIFIPDCHILDNEREQQYQYHFNCYDLLIRLMQQLKEFKREVGRNNASCTVYQLGDFFDLWREIPDYLEKKKIEEMLPVYVEKMQEDRFPLYREMRDPALNVQFVLGNHDFDIHYLENYINNELTYFFPVDENRCTAGAVMHGDLFSMSERMIPETFKHFGVYYFGPFVKGHTIDIGKLRKEIMASHKGKDYRKFIQEAPLIRLNKFLSIKGLTTMPEENFNVYEVRSKEDYKQDDFKYAKESREYLQMINDETGMDMRFVVIGHTHHARIVIDRTDSQFTALIDCGAWIQCCTGIGVEEPMPSAQLGIIYNNEARIYQLHAKQLCPANCQ